MNLPLLLMVPLLGWNAAPLPPDRGSRVPVLARKLELHMCLRTCCKLGR